MARLLVSAVLLSALFTISLASVEDLGPLRRVVLLHRHGARTPLVNTSGACGDIAECGSITEQGILMMRSLGNTFRERYGAILPSSYHGRSFSSKSDLTPRVIQSSSAFLEGLFEYNASYTVYPAINSDNLPIIDLYSSGARPLHLSLVRNQSLSAITQRALQIVNMSDIAAVAVELQMNVTTCEAEVVDCLRKQVDFIESVRAQGSIGDYPIGARLLPQLIDFRTMYWRYLFYTYDAVQENNTYLGEAGYPSSQLLMDMIGSMAGGPAVSEYSGHDTTIMPLYIAMGNLTYNYPHFATALVFEVYGDEHSPFVKPLIAECGQLPGTHPYHFTANAITCTNAQGEQYVTEAGCPLADLERFAASRVGTKSLPNECYAWPEDLTFSGCTGDAKVKSDSACGKFRSACALYACAAGDYMTPDLACHSEL